MVYRRLNCSSCLDVLCCRTCRGNRECCPCLIPKSAPEASRMLTFAGFLAFIALLFISIGLLVPVLLDRSLDRGLHQLKALDSTDSRAYKLFSSNDDYPIKLELFMYNITNPTAVLNEGALPVFDEVGPYTYHLYRQAMNVSWDNEATELTYRYYNRFIFDAESSVGSDEDLFYSPNIVFWSIAGNLRYNKEKGGQLALIYNFIYKDKAFDLAFIHRPVKEIIYGYGRDTDPLLDMMKQDNLGLIKNHTSPEDSILKAKLDTIRTGYPDIRSLHQYVKYQEQEVLLNADESGPAWPKNPEAGLIRGSDGGAFPAPVTETSRPELFLSSFYRSIELEFVDKRRYKGINMLRFTVPDSMWRTSKEVPENAKFNQNKWTGVLNLTDPTCNAPMYLTRPRMRKVDKDALKGGTYNYLPSVKDTVDSDYESAFHVEPTMSAAMSIAIVNQFNIIMEPMDITYTVHDDDDDTEEDVTFRIFPNMTAKAPMFSPVFWANQSIMVSDEDAHAFRSTVYAVFRIMEVAPIVGYCVGGVIALIALLLALRGYRYHQLYRFEGHVFVETDNVDGNFAATDAAFRTRVRRFSDAKPGRADGGNRGEAEGVNLDSLAAHQPSRRSYGTTGSSAVSSTAASSLDALGARDPLAPGPGARAAAGGASGSAAGAVYSVAASPVAGAGDAAGAAPGAVVGEGSRSVTVDAPEVDY